jgi:hypothetical protein
MNTDETKYVVRTTQHSREGDFYHDEIFPSRSIARRLLFHRNPKGTFYQTITKMELIEVNGRKEDIIYTFMNPNFDKEFAEIA